VRIAQVTYSYKPITGGADVYAASLHRTLTEAGHESVVYQAARPGCARGDGPHPSSFGTAAARPTQDRPLPEGEGAVPPGGEGEVRLIPLTVLSGPGVAPFWTAPLGLGKLRDELARFDVLIAHYPNYYRPIRWHPCTILLSHGVWWDDRPGALRSRLKRRLAREAYRQATAVVANDTFFLREMGVDAQPGLAPHTEIEPGRWYVPNAVDTDVFHPEGDPPPGPPVILVPRNLYRNRGVHLAIEALALLRRELDAQMRVVGAFSQPGYVTECQALAARLGVAEVVEFAGPRPWQEMPVEYRAAHLVLVPSLCGEGTSLSALESMACGTPCVATRVAGLKDLPAVLTDPNPEALAQACAQTLEGRYEIAARQLDAVRSGFSMQRWRESWLRVIEQAAAAAGIV